MSDADVPTLCARAGKWRLFDSASWTHYILSSVYNAGKRAPLETREQESLTLDSTNRKNPCRLAGDYGLCLLGAALSTFWVSAVSRNVGYRPECWCCGHSTIPKSRKTFTDHRKIWIPASGRYPERQVYQYQYREIFQPLHPVTLRWWHHRVRGRLGIRTEWMCVFPDDSSIQGHGVSDCSSGFAQQCAEDSQQWSDASNWSPVF